jgi:hypothetical protein
LRKKLENMIKAARTDQFDAAQAELQGSLSYKIDIFLFGRLLLYILNNGKTWDDASNLIVSKETRLVDQSKNFFDKFIYQIMEGLIIRCLLVGHPRPDHSEYGFLSMYDVSKAIEEEFGFFMKKIHSIHAQYTRPETVPTRDSPLYQFKALMREFYSYIYFKNFPAALKSFSKASRLRSQLGKDNQQLLESFEFNQHMIRWLKGTQSASFVLFESEKHFTINMLGHTNDYKNMYQAAKLLPTVIDSRFLYYFDSMFSRVVESYLYQDENKKDTLINSA